MRIGVIMYQTSLTKGQELVAQRMVKEFRRQGHEAYLITSIYHDWEPAVGGEAVKGRGGYIHLFDEVLGIPLVRVDSQMTAWPPRRIAFVDFVANLTSIVDELKLNVLITHSTLWNGPEETLKFVEWRRNQVKGGAPVRPVVFCHMSHFQEPTTQRYDITERSFRDAWNNTSLPLILKGADFVLVTTPYEKEWMKKNGADEQKCVLFPGGIDLEGLDKGGEGQRFREKYAIGKDLKLISYLGTVEERKNAGALVRVARGLEDRNDIHFVIAGRLEGEYADQVKGEASGLKNVSLTGPIPDEEVPALVQATYANITLSRSEALGLAQLEFMYAGVPVITSGVGGQAWVVKNRVNGIVLGGPEDVEGARKAVLELVDHPPLREKLGGRAKSIASLYTMPLLISRLSRVVSKRLGQITGAVFVAQDMSSTERVLEAWVAKGYRVAATSTRLIISSGGEMTTSIPYDEILRVRRKVVAKWVFPVLGAVASAFVAGIALSGIPESTAFSSQFSQALSRYFAREVVNFLVGSALLWPLAVGLLALLLTLKRGYVIEYAGSRTIFLPREFYKALKFADDLTVRSLFTAEAG